MHVSLGVIGICRKERTLLMAERGEDPQARTWAFPGGGIEEGELPEQAIVREWEEELGVRPEVVGLIGLAHRAVPKETHVLYLFELCLPAKEGAIRVDGLEAIRYAWITEAGLEDLHARDRLASPRDYFVARFVWRHGSDLGPLRPEHYTPPADANRPRTRTALYLTGGWGERASGRSVDLRL